MKRVLFLFALFLTCMPLSAQKKAETRLYARIIANPAVESFDRFLKKYPSSVYAKDIMARKDTLLSISPYSAADAESILGEFVPEGASSLSFAYRREAVDRVCGVFVGSESIPVGAVRLVVLKSGKGGWEVESSYDAPLPNAESMVARALVDGSEVVGIRNKDYLRFNLLLSSEDRSAQTYCACFYGPMTDSFDCVSFTGKNVLKDDRPYNIEGRSDFVMQQNTSSPLVALLGRDIDSNPSLVAISDADYITDKAIEWWLEKNPDALTSARNISFGLVPEGSSLASRFNGSKKESASRYQASMFDIRGYTVVVAQNRSNGEYILAWAEQECTDHKNGRLLNNIYFEDGSSLVLYYYHGRKTFKYRLNLSNKSLIR